tara:strand:+ start:163 stop:762 length:600 start_codon:yes stop_codon:yes gene_type:complete
MFTNKEYILASSSKSRYKILRNSGLNFRQVRPLCDEEQVKIKIAKDKKTPINIAQRLSFEKAKSVSEIKRYMKNYVIGCDTLIYLNDNIFDKAKNMKEAYDKIVKLSGKKHIIVSALTICKNGKKIWQCYETSEVKIRNLKKNEIQRYLKKTGKQILQSVGCYQLESHGPIIIEDIRGDFFNVMGLPLFKLLKHISNKK